MSAMSASSLWVGLVELLGRCGACVSSGLGVEGLDNAESLCLLAHGAVGGIHNLEERVGLGRFGSVGDPDSLCEGAANLVQGVENAVRNILGVLVVLDLDGGVRLLRLLAQVLLAMCLELGAVGGSARTLGFLL